MTSIIINSPIFENIYMISDQNISNRICTIHINKKEIQIPLLIGISISSLISKQLLSDISMTDFYINDPLFDNITDDFLIKIKKLLNHEEIQLENEDEIEQIAIFGKIIGNQKFLKPFYKQLKKYEENINEENVISLIKQKLLFNLPFSELQTEISFISSNFPKFIDKLIELGNDIKYQDVITSIIQNENLKLNTEDELLAFIIKLCQEDSKVYELLFEYVWLEYCSIDCINEFLVYINNNICNDNHSKCIMKCISRRLIQNIIPVKQYDQKRYIDQYEKYEYDENNPLDGILRKEYLKGNVEMRTSGRLNNDVYDLLKNDSTADFRTTDLENSWIEGNLKNKKPFKISKYMIRGNKWSGTDNQLRSWKLEGKRISDEKWIELDNHINENFDRLLLKTFPIECDDVFNTIRLTQTGPNTSNHLRLMINAFDIFGEVQK